MLTLLVVFAVLGAKSTATAQALNIGVINQRPIELGQYVRPLQLSPDGRWIAGWNLKDESLCFYDVVFFDPISCLDEDAPLNGAIDIDRLAWSPDGSSVAFTEYFYDFVFRESDLWVYSIEAGRLTNLTEDSAGGKFRRPDDCVRGIYCFRLDASLAHVDVFPAWSPDGQWVAFARTTVERERENQGTSLLRVAVTGGAPVHVTDVSSEPFAVSNGLQWTPDRAALVYIASTYDSPWPRDSVAVADLGTGELRPIVDAEPVTEEWLEVMNISNEGLVRLDLVDVSSKGMALLRLNVAGLPETALVDLNMGTVAILRADFVRESDVPAAPMYQVTFSPDGDQILYMARDQTLAIVVAVQEIGWSGHLLLSEIDSSTFALNKWGFTWATNGTVLLPGEDRLLQLGPVPA